MLHIHTLGTGLYTNFGYPTGNFWKIDSVLSNNARLVEEKGP